LKPPKQEVQRGQGAGGGSPELSPKATKSHQDGEPRWGPLHLLFLAEDRDLKGGQRIFGPGSPLLGDVPACSKDRLPLP